jgi:hypothetical protein
MFARMLRMQIHLDRIDEAAKLFEENVIPIIKDTKGYIEAKNRRRSSRYRTQPAFSRTTGQIHEFFRHTPYP